MQIPPRVTMDSRGLSGSLRVSWHKNRKYAVSDNHIQLTKYEVGSSKRVITFPFHLAQCLLSKHVAIKEGENIPWPCVEWSVGPLTWHHKDYIAFKYRHE